MKKYIQSFRVFFGSCQIRSMLIFAVIIAGTAILCGILSALPVNDLLDGFMQGVSSMMSAMSAVFGIIFLNALYQYISPVTPGYKYYRSLPDGAAHFRRAIAAGNILGILSGLVLITLVSAFNVLIRVDNGSSLFGIVLLFLAAGVCNLTGYVRNNTARIIAMMGVLCLFGFSAGFLDGSGEADGFTALEFLSQNIVTVIAAGAIAVTVFLAGFIYALRAAEKKWGEVR